MPLAVRLKRAKGSRMAAIWPEPTKFPDRTDKQTKQERGDVSFEVPQRVVPYRRCSAHAGGDNGKHVISVMPAATPKAGSFGGKNYTTNPVGMTHCAETPSERISAHAGRLHAHLDG